MYCGAVARIDFKETKQKILERPLYCKAMRNLTPTKQPVAEVTEKEEDNKETSSEDVPTETINKLL